MQKKNKNEGSLLLSVCALRTVCTECVAGNDNEVMATLYLRNKSEEPNTVNELNRTHLVLVPLEYI